MRLPFLLVFAFLLTAADGSKDGRRGNALYEQGSYEAATTAYQEGIAKRAEGTPGPVLSGLLNNLGASLYRQENYEEAREALTRSVQAADAEADRVRANYNAGNTAYRLQDLETSLAFYRDALLEDPDNADAKFNYEFVRRQLEQQQQQQQQQGDQNQENQEQEQNEEGEQQENQDGQNQEGGDQEGEQQGENEQDPDADQESEEQQQGNQGEQQDQEQQQQQQPSQPQDPTQLSRAEAERILQAMQNDEAELLREVMKMDARPRRVEKDW